MASFDWLLLLNPVVNAKSQALSMGKTATTSPQLTPPVGPVSRPDADVLAQRINACVARR